MKSFNVAVVVISLAVLSACGGGGGYSSPASVGYSSSSVSSSSSSSSSASSSSSSSVMALKSLVATLGFPIGVAVSAATEAGSIFTVTSQQPTINAQFNSLVAGNIMKMSYLEPTQNNFTFADADALYAYTQAHGMVLHGHTLIWHSDYQVPSFMKTFSGTPTEWDALLTNHVQQVAAHFAGKVISWDVVNEAINDSNPAGWRTSLFYTNSNNSSVYIENAFKTAHASDGAAKLFYNDYNMESSTIKLNFMLAMVDDFKSRSIPIDGIGFQMHVTLTYPDINTIKAAFQAVVLKGLLVRVSELDVAVNSGNTLTSLDATTALAQKQRYKDIVNAYLTIVPMAQRGGITVWGLTDGDSWLNTSTPPHSDWPLLFNNDYSTKPAFDGVAEALSGM